MNPPLKSFSDQLLIVVCSFFFITSFLTYAVLCWLLSDCTITGLWLNVGRNIFSLQLSMFVPKYFPNRTLIFLIFVNKQLALILTIFFLYFSFSCNKQMHFICIFFFYVCAAIPKCNSIMLCIFVASCCCCFRVLVFASTFNYRIKKYIYIYM